MIGVLLEKFPVIPIDTSLYETHGVLICQKMEHSRRYEVEAWLEISGTNM